MSDARDEKRGVLLEIAYDGSGFSGWATQIDTRTVEETVRGALRAVDPRANGPRGSSRTDAGVHADGHPVAFDTSLTIPPRGWVLALNQHLPDDVAVRRAREVPKGFHPRFASVKKRYAYRVVQDRVRSPLLRTTAWRVGFELDVERMRREARSLLGTHDFAAFRAAGDARKDTTRTIADVRIERSVDDPRILSFVVEGRAFLYNMVRIIVGTLIDVGRGRLPEGTVRRALEGRERILAGQTAPACGLVLQHVELDLPEGAGEPWPL